MTYFYRLSKLYAAILKLLGYERGIGRFLDRVPLARPEDCRILDVACGSGIVGLTLAQRFPRSTLLATDLQANFLQETQSNARQRGFDTRRVSVGTSDLSEPRKVTCPDGAERELRDASFDIVSVGGALGYAQDVEHTARELIRLAKPGGYFINVEMNTGIVGRFVAWLYSYRPLPTSTLEQIAAEGGHQLSLIRFSLREFPANLTRIGVVVRVNPA
jgi:ubiquinone/menaquinone biosynthesis C-methylase UbiE